MSSPSHSQHQDQDEDLPIENKPNSTLNEENQAQQHPHSQPQSPQTQTPDPQNPEPSDLNHPQDQQQHGAPQFLDREEPDDLDLDDDNPEPQQSGMSLTAPTNPQRRTNNKRKKGVRNNPKKQQAIEKKILTLTQNLRPIPFIPSKTLDFPKHEKLLKRLGLWDFVHVEFDQAIRIDLIAQLIATYDSKSRCSYVNEFRIGVTRPDLARAFKLPVKMEKENVLDGVDLDLEALSEESIAFIEDFVLNWVLLHEDMWMMPNEVLCWMMAIKDGHPEKVDWAHLFWLMVEEELTQGEHLEDCYYASHLQYLIKFQREEVLREEPKAELAVEVEEEVDGSDGDAKIDDFNEDQVQDNVVLDEPNIELTLGQDLVEKEEEVKDDDVMDVEECKVKEHGQWLLGVKNNVGEHFLQRCRLVEAMSLDSDEEGQQEDEEGEEEEEEEEEDEEEAEDGFYIAPNEDILERNGLTGNLLQGMETNLIPFNVQRQLHDQTSVFASRAETPTISGGLSIYGNSGKRELCHEHDIPGHSLNGSTKRLRTDSHWDHKSYDFGMCMEQAQQWMEKAKAMHEEREPAYQESNRNQQILISELQRRDSMIEHMHKNKCAELQKKDGEIYRLERELYVMGNLLGGYRKALKESHKAFLEYRQRHQLPEVPLYKDAGLGGLVLSTTELEKRRKKQEEEDRLNLLLIEQKFKDAEEVYIGKFEVHLNKVRMLDDRLMDFENEVKLLKELPTKRKVSEASGCAPSK